MTADSDPPIVCRVTPEGEVICDPVSPGTDLAIDPAVQKQAEAAFRAMYPKGDWGPNKIRLALRVLAVLSESTLPDEPNIPRRSGEIVDSVRLLLDKQPPSILLYNYSSQPADILGAYFLNKAELVRMQRLYETFKTPSPS